MSLSNLKSICLLASSWLVACTEGGVHFFRLYIRPLYIDEYNWQNSSYTPISRYFHFFDIVLCFCLFLYCRRLASLILQLAHDRITLYALVRAAGDDRTSRCSRKELWHWRWGIDNRLLASSAVPPSVCYQDFGCCSPRPGFKLLPESPEKINTQFLLFARWVVQTITEKKAFRLASAVGLESNLVLSWLTWQANYENWCVLLFSLSLREVHFSEASHTKTWMWLLRTGLVAISSRMNKPWLILSW